MQHLALLKQLAVGIRKLYGSQCEVVIHDFTDLEHSIVHMEGNITGRSIGGGATDFILSRIVNNNAHQDVYNYQTQLPNGHALKSCTMFLHDDQGKVCGAFCINLDVTAMNTFQRFLDDYLSIDDNEVSETFSDDIQSTIHELLLETVGEMGYDMPILTRKEKVDLIAKLDKKGVFQVKKSVPILADELGFSRSTVYNYLSETRGIRVNGED